MAIVRGQQMTVCWLDHRRLKPIESIGSGDVLDVINACQWHFPKVILERQT
jgi:hypothetical protein